MTPRTPRTRSTRVWQSRYDGVQTLGQLWTAVNYDDSLLLEVVRVIETKFWFVGILEESDISIALWYKLFVGGSKTYKVSGLINTLPRPRSLLMNLPSVWPYI